ncbi:MAG: hypothetical protein KDE19_14015 [Caldilineaceae bacterium]|nr:hypothetical protein [Caldilineaceae bacterium]
MHTLFDRLEIHALGPVVVTWQRTRTVLSLSPREEAFLIFLAYQTIPLSRAQLCDLFWPEEVASRARGNLRKLLADIRKSLRDIVCTDRNSVWLLEGQYWLDVHEFQRHLYLIGTAQGPTDSDVVHLTKAVNLYHGDFMANRKQPQSKRFAEWIEENQQTLHDQATAVFKQLLAYYIQTGQFTSALLMCKRLLELDALDEEVNGQFLRLLANQNQLSVAMAHYGRYAQLIAHEVGGEVEPELKELYQQLKAGIIPPLSATAQVGQLSNTQQAHSPAQPIPMPLTPLIGRSVLLNQIYQYLQSSSVRLVTLTGLGGVGKTRVALALVEKMASHFVDGVYYIPLKPGPEPSRHLDGDGTYVREVNGGEVERAQQQYQWLIRNTAQVIGVDAKEQNDDLAERISRQLRSRNQLLIFDGFEDLVEGASFLVQLLQDAPMVKVLITSREVLQLAGELVIQVEGLGLVEGVSFVQFVEGETSAQEIPSTWSADEATVDLRNAPCVQLFTSCAERHNPEITFTSAAIRQIAQVCYLLEGNPLAIELVAGLINHYQYGELIALLQENLQALDALSHGRAGKQQSMQRVLEESWRSLTPVEQTTLTHLSALPSNFSRDKALQLEGVSPASLIGLTQKSMVRAIGHGRYHMPRIVQLFATQKRHH